MSGLRGYLFLYPFRDLALADRFAKDLLRAGVPGRLSDFIHVSKEDQLTGKDLRALLSGATQVGLNPNGVQWSLQLDKDGGQGILRWSGSDDTDAARIWVEGDTICSQLEKITLGRETCGVVYKNSRGSPERRDEYVNISDRGVRFWSVVRRA